MIMDTAIKSFRTVFAAAFVLVPLGMLSAVLPSSTSIIVTREWTKRKAILMISYRIAVVAFMTWIGW